ncbi:MAG TPA: universal stress protein [Jatrophihabitantaceae bacterium]|jgi:nucleotide-binding universal stress UspA family protein
MMTEAGIVVGVDGSAGGEAALTWAAEEARRRCVGLRVVYVGDEPAQDGLSPRTLTAVAADLERHGHELLCSGASAVAARQPTVSVTPTYRRGRAADVLIELSDSTTLIVLGRHGTGDNAAAIVGAVSHKVAAYGRCPVVVVPASFGQVAATHPAAVIVGVGRSDEAMSALDAGFQHAQRAHAKVVAVRAWGELDWAHYSGTYTPETAERWRQASEHILDECVSRLWHQYPSVPVETRLVRGRATDALLDAASEADLLLIGGPSSYGVRTSRLGWIGMQLVAQAPCPVEVVSWPLIRSALPRSERAPSDRSVPCVSS